MKHQCVAVIAILASAGAAAAPLPTRDQNPLLAGFGLPMPMPARIAPEDQRQDRAWQVDADLNWGSSALLQQRADEVLFVDAETRELRLTIARVAAGHFMYRLQIPWRYTGAGVLDGFIDSWHDVFGLPEGVRPMLPDDRVRFVYERNGARLLDVQSSSSGLGDISADAGYRLMTTPASSASLWLSLKLPTGDAADFTGSGAADLSFIVAGEHRFNERWSAFGQVGATYLGDGELLAAQQRNVLWSGLAGVSARVTRRLELQLQIDAHSTAFDDSGLDYFGDAVILSIGGSWHFDSGWKLSVGVSEDIAVAASPDVVFIFGINRRWNMGKP